MGLRSEEIIKVSELKQKYTRQLIKENCKPSSAKIKMLRELRKNYSLVCCSNAIKSSVEDMLERAGIIKYFDLIIGNDEIEFPKPNPEIYLRAFKELGVKPKDCLIVEDAPHGIEAAKASGARVFAVRGYKDVNINLFEGLI